MLVHRYCSGHAGRCDLNSSLNFVHETPIIASLLRSFQIPSKWQYSVKVVVQAGLDFVDRGLDGRAIAEGIHEA